MNSGHHEDFQRELSRQGPSDRKFAAVFSAVCFLLGIWPMLRGRPVRPLWLVICAGFLIVGFLHPALLSPANRLWTQLGLWLGRLVNPIVTALLFYLVFSPAAFVIRWMGKDLLALARDEAADSYWIRRSSSDTSGMSNQF